MADALEAAERALGGLSLGDAAGPVVVVGRGYGFPIALEIALKLREVGVRNAQGFSAADLLHGHIAAVRPGTAAILAGAAGPTLPSLVDCAAALRARGARTFVMSDAPELRQSADVLTHVLGREPEIFSYPFNSYLAGDKERCARYFRPPLPI